MENPVSINLVRIGITYGLTWRFENATSDEKLASIQAIIGDLPCHQNITSHTGLIESLPFPVLQHIGRELLI